jgi:hypothetical protein
MRGKSYNVGTAKGTCVLKHSSVKSNSKARTDRYHHGHKANGMLTIIIHMALTI